MVVKFRNHRQLLVDSMATQVEVQDLEELFQIINKDLSRFMEIDKDKISIEYYGFDGRINQEAYIVTYPDYGVLGFTDSEFPIDAK